MTNPEATDWPDFKSFAADDARRASSFRVPLGPAWEVIPDPSRRRRVVLEDWELVWLPATGEVIQRLVADPHAVKLLGRTLHRDYLDDVLDDDDTPAGEERPMAEASAQRRRRDRNWRRDALVYQLQWWQTLLAKPEQHEDPADGLPDYGHTRSQVDQSDWGEEIWADLDTFVGSLAGHASAFLVQLGGDFNLAAAANEAMELADIFVCLRRILVEAYARAHQGHPGFQNQADGPDATS